MAVFTLETDHPSEKDDPSSKSVKVFRKHGCMKLWKAVKAVIIAELHARKARASRAP